MGTSYRSRIYEKYATTFQDAHPTFDIAAASRWGKAYRYYFRDWLPSDEQASILEVACGGGRLLHLLKTIGYSRVSGVDISPQQVELSRQVLPSIAQDDAIAFLESRRDTFDLVIGLDIVEHFFKDEALRFLDACFNSLRPGGRLILQTPNADSPWGSAHRYNDFTHELGFNPNAIVRLLRLVGFRAVEARELGPVPFGYSFVSTLRAAVWQIIRGCLKLWNVAEIGNAGSGIFTRIFVVSASK